MIHSKKELRFYIQEDAKRNSMDCSYVVFLSRLFRRQENAIVFRYLKVLRKCEYHSNNKSVYHNLMRVYYDVLRQRIGARYSIQIPLNRCGYGLRIMHLSGGGCFTKL